MPRVYFGYECTAMLGAFGWAVYARHSQSFGEECRRDALAAFDAWASADTMSAGGLRRDIAAAVFARDAISGRWAIRRYAPTGAGISAIFDGFRRFA